MVFPWGLVLEAILGDSVWGDLLLNDGSIPLLVGFHTFQGVLVAVVPLLLERFALSQ